MSSVPSTSLIVTLSVFRIRNIFFPWNNKMYTILSRLDTISSQIDSLVKYRGPNKQFPVFAIVVRFIPGISDMKRMSYDTWVDADEALTFSNICLNTMQGMRPENTGYDMFNYSVEVKSIGKDDDDTFLIHLQLLYRKESNDELKIVRILSIKLDDRTSSWSDLKKFILSCNRQVLTREMIAWEDYHINADIEISKKVLNENMEVAEENIKYKERPQTKDFAKELSEM